MANGDPPTLAGAASIGERIAAAQQELLEGDSIPELLESEDEHDEREQHRINRLKALAQRVQSLSPVERVEAAKLVALIVTARMAETSFAGWVPQARDIELFFPEGEYGNLDRELLEAVFENFNRAHFLGQTEEEAQRGHVAADPVVMMNGQFVHTSEDVKLGGAGMDFVFTRTYKNRTFYDGPLGTNWDHTYNLFLRAEFGGTVLARSSGQLREDRYVFHEQHHYFVPPDGYHDVIVARDHFVEHANLLACCAEELAPGHPYSFVLRTPAGGAFLYEPLPEGGVHRIAKIRDRAGNYLAFEYDGDNLLRVVRVNSDARFARFDYDSNARIAAIALHGVSYAWNPAPVERTWRYEYDELNDLVAFVEPAPAVLALDGASPELRVGHASPVTRYEYSTATSAGALRHNMVRIADADGRVVLENDYGEADGLVNFNRVVRQRQGGGEYQFEYADMVGDESAGYTAEERPDRKTVLYDRTGHCIEHYYNAAGRLVLRREETTTLGVISPLVWRFRYNADGALASSMSPHGRISQYYLGREDFYDRALGPGDPAVEPALDPRLTAAERIRFGNLLASVKRGARWSPRLLASRLPDDGFRDLFPSILTRSDPADVVRKFTYTDDYQQIATSSDPRFTTSPDPRAQEPASYDAHLTRFEYGPGPAGLLRRVAYPDTAYPEPLADGSAGPGPATDEYLAYDTRGRLLRSADSAGAVTVREYAPAATGPREGYLVRVVREQASVRFGATAPDVALARWGNGWARQATYRESDGQAGRAVEIDFAGCAIELFQDEAPGVVRGANPAAAVALVDGAGVVTPLDPWDQTQAPSYEVAGLPSGVYTLRLRDDAGIALSLGRADVRRQCEFEANEAGLVTAERDGRGMRSTYAVDELNRAVARTAPPPLGYRTFTRYAASGLVESTVRELDPPGGAHRYQVVTSTYDDQHNVIRETFGGDAAEALVTSHGYDAEGRRTKTRHPRGNEVWFRYDERGLMTDVIRAACTSDESIVRAGYDGDGLRTLAVDPRGNRTWFGYDAIGRALLVEDPAGTLTRSTHDALDNVVGIYVFARRDRRFFLMSKRAYEYDERGRKRREAVFVFDAPIDAEGFDPTDPSSSPDRDEHFPAFRRAVDAGLVSELRTDLYLDRKGRVVRTERYGVLPQDPMTMLPVLTRSETTERRFDALDRAIWSRDGLGSTTVTTYDPNGNAIRRDVHEAVADPATGLFAYEEVFSFLGEFDALDRLAASVDPLGNRTELDYDSRSHVVERRDALGNVTGAEFDVYDRLVRSRAEMTATGLGGGAVVGELATAYAYDANGNLVETVAPNGARTRYEYDAMDRRTRAREDAEHDGSFEAWSYDAASNVVRHRDNNGLSRVYAYDGLNRSVAAAVDPAGVADADLLAEDADDSVEIAFDSLGRALSRRNKHALIEATYDSLGRQLEERTWLQSPPPGAPQPLVVGRRFDVFSNVVERVYPGGRRVAADYDALGRPERIRNLANGGGYPGDPATPDEYEIARVEYAGLRRRGCRYADGTTDRRAYDGAGRLVGVTHSDAAGAPLLELQVLADGAGNPRFEVAIRPVAGQPAVAAEDYFYDSLYRLTRFGPSPRGPIALAPFQPTRELLEPSGLTGQLAIDAAVGPLAQPPDATFAYDATDNRVVSTEPAEPERRYTPNLRNQYEEVVEAAAPTRPVYDPAGNTTRVGARRYAYDPGHRLARVDDGGNTIARYAYDPLGRLLVARYPASNLELTFVHDDANVVAEYALEAGVWSCRAQYVCGREPDERYQVAAGRVERYYHVDPSRSTRLLTSANGEVFEYVYAPFGQTVAVPVTPVHNPYRYTGRRLDDATGLYDFRARTYTAEWGRFLQRDPKGAPDGPNRYAAFGNNPKTYLDPSGTERVSYQSLDPTVVFSKRGDLLSTAREAHIEEVLQEARHAYAGGNKEAIGDAMSRLNREGQEEYLKLAAASYFVSVMAALGGELGMALAVELELGAIGTGVLSGVGHSLGHELAENVIGKEFEAETFAFDTYLNVVLGGAVGRFGGGKYPRPKEGGFEPSSRGSSGITAAGEILGDIPPSSLARGRFGTASFGQAMEAEMEAILRARFPRTKFKFRTGAGNTGPDVEWVGGQDPGFDIGDFKPDSLTGYRKFVTQTRVWSAEGWSDAAPKPSVLRSAYIAYRADGTVYVGDIGFAHP